MIVFTNSFTCLKSPCQFKKDGGIIHLKSCQSFLSQDYKKQKVKLK